jgi:small subunit ribosomal protein S2
MKNISTKELFNVQSHLGHLKKYRNPKLSRFIFKTHNKQDILNLDITLLQIKTAKEHLDKFEKDDILLLSKYEIEPNEINTIKKWKPGMLTNFHFGKLAKLPKALIVDSVHNNLIAVKEANKCGVQVIGICDTNSSINGVDIPIVMNDDNSKAMQLLINYLIN